MANIIQIRRDTAANWTSANPILAQGEPGFETDTLRLKVGDGTTAWNSLDYYSTNVASVVTFEVLNANGDVGSGSNQVAVGDHTHSQYLTAITKAMVEAVLTGTITSHNHEGQFVSEETDPVFTAWDKSTGISITEDQISDLKSYLTEIADSSITESKLAPAYKTIEDVSSNVLDWSKMGGTKTLTADTSFTFSNIRKGVYFLETTGDYNVLFPSGFNYAGGERASSGTTLYQIVNTTGTGGWYVILKAES